MMKSRIENKINEIQNDETIRQEDRKILLAALNLLNQRIEITQAEIASVLEVSYNRLNKLIRLYVSDVFDARLKHSQLKSSSIEKIKKIENLIEQKPLISQVEIAKELGVSRQAVQQFLQRYFPNFDRNKQRHFEEFESGILFLTPPKQSTLKKLKLFRSLVQGKERYNVAEIAKRCEISLSLYRVWQGDLGASVIERAKSYNLLLEKVRGLEKQGVSRKSIAQTIGISLGKLERWFSKGQKPLDLFSLE